MMTRRSTVRMALTRSLGLVAVVAMSAAGATVLGQQPPASPQRQPLLDGKGYVREDAYIPAPLPETLVKTFPDLLSSAEGPPRGRSDALPSAK